MNSVTNGHRVARPRFTGSDPNILRILRIERDGADGLHRLLVKYGSKSRAAVVGFPDAAAGRAYKERDFTRGFACCGDGRDATAHGSRTDITRAQAGDCCGSKRPFLSIEQERPKEKAMLGRIALQTHCARNQKRFRFGFAKALAVYERPHVAFGDSISS